LFKSTEGYHDTLSHEIGHSTGKALGRDLTGRFGAEGEAGKKYAYEELCAELSSSFMAVELSLKHSPSSHENHSAYLKSWIKALENDKFMLSKASNQASKSTEFQMGKFNEYKLELDQKNEQEQTQEKAQEKTQDKSKEQDKSAEKKPKKTKELSKSEISERIKEAKEILKPKGKTKEIALTM
jgi:antirestriction protein ArdC